jgi:acyl-CoA thioesterase II
VFDRILGLAEEDTDVFVGPNPGDWPGGRVFGGLVAAQALRAATRTVRPDHAPHSLHAYFVRPGRPGVPIDHAVDRTRDGRSFTTRRVDSRQDGEVIFTLSASFHRDEPGPEYELPMATDVPAPEDLDPPGWPFSGSGALTHLELREVGPTPPEPDGTYRSTRRVWLRARDVGADPLMHACALTFMSDLGVVMAARPPRPGTTWDAMMPASLDHAVWFHRPVRADQWLLYDLHALANHGARGMVRGVIHERSGALVASVAQEVLIRPLREGPPPAGVPTPNL